MVDELAVNGGTPVWSGAWPQWPVVETRDAELLQQVLQSRRWAVSGEWTGTVPLDVVLAKRFAAFVGADWCIPVDHGSSALLIGLQTLGVRPGDEVIVPGLTWVACASVVARAGAVPVLVDIDEQTLCLDPAAVEAAVTSRTTAIIAVHLYCVMADMDALRAVADRHGLALIEDAAQAHGATWRGRRAGSLGDVGAFSVQQGKALTSGEGGLFVTSDRSVRDRAEMLRGDGRQYVRHPVAGVSQLGDRTEVQGWNMHLSEFQAALLLSGLERLNAQNAIRAEAGRMLDDQLGSTGDLLPVRPYLGNDGRAYYHYAVRLAPDSFAGRDAEEVSQALSAELGTWVHPPYPPLNRHPLFDPRRLPVARDRVPGAGHDLDPHRFALPVAEQAHRTTVLIHHSLLLADRSELARIGEAFDKVRRAADRISRRVGTGTPLAPSAVH